MKLSYPYLLPGERPITSIAEYYESREQYEKLLYKMRHIRAEIINREEVGEEINQKLYEELNSLTSQRIQFMIELSRRHPNVLVSYCPYCATPIWMKVNIFSLSDGFWYQESGNSREVDKETECSHLFCVDGALNLKGHQPVEVYQPRDVVSPDRITMASEVPFIKPRVLNLPTMVAVLHSFSIANKYTAYPIAYFAEHQPNQIDFCIGWARNEYVDKALDSHGQPTRATFIGRRSDVQDYELEKWIRQGKLFWLDLDDENHALVRGPVETFPYSNVFGRSHPYAIKEGRVHNLRNPRRDSNPKYEIEY